MQRTLQNRRWIFAALLLGSVGCGPRSTMNNSFGSMYKEHFAQQMSVHRSRETMPVMGDEARRIYNTYSEGLGMLPGAMGAAPAKSGGSSSFNF
jgi:PAB1-binding protein PBP1